MIYFCPGKTFTRPNTVVTPYKDGLVRLQVFQLLKIRIEPTKLLNTRVIHVLVTGVV